MELVNSDKDHTAFPSQTTKARRTIGNYSGKYTYRETDIKMHSNIQSHLQKQRKTKRDEKRRSFEKALGDTDNKIQMLKSFIYRLGMKNFVYVLLTATK